MNLHQDTHLNPSYAGVHEDLPPECDGVSCGCYVRGTGCMLKLRRVTPPPVPDEPYHDMRITEGFKVLEAPLPEVVEPYQPWTNPDEIAEKRKRLVLGTMALAVVALTGAYFWILHVRMRDRVIQLAQSGSSALSPASVSRSTAASAKGGEQEPPHPVAMADGFNQLLMAAAPDAATVDLSSPKAPEMTVVEAEKRGQALMADLFAVGSIQRQASAVAGGMTHSAAIATFFSEAGGPGKLLDVRMFQEPVRDIETGDVWPLLYVETDKSMGRGVLTRLVPVPGGVWKLDFEMLVDSFGQRLAALAKSSESTVSWAGLLSRRTTGMSEASEIRSRYLVLDCVADASGQDRQPVLVDKESELAQRLKSSMDFGTGYSGHAKLAMVEIGGRPRLLMRDFRRDRE